MLSILINRLNYRPNSITLKTNLNLFKKCLFLNMFLELAFDLVSIHSTFSNHLFDQIYSVLPSCTMYAI